MMISIRTKRDEDDARIVEIYNRTNPDRPPQTMEEFRHRLRAVPERAEDTWLVAERDGEIVGYANRLRQVLFEREGSFWAQVRVLPGLERQGIGSALYTMVERSIREMVGASIYGEIRDDRPDAEGFLTHRGFRRTGHGDQLSRLDVAQANLEKSRAAARRVEAEGIRITTLAELGMDEELLRAVWRLDNATSRDVPGQADFTGTSYEEWYRFAVEAPGMRPEIAWVALDGERVVGLCPLELRSEGYADNAYTAVDRAYRGRGIARAMKLRTIEWAQANGIRYIYTGNDVQNKPMLAINIDLGYQMLPANVEMVKSLIENTPEGIAEEG